MAGQSTFRCTDQHSLDGHPDPRARRHTIAPVRPQETGRNSRAHAPEAMEDDTAKVDPPGSGDAIPHRNPQTASTRANKPAHGTHGIAS
jgi:hypothetical protein